VPLAPVSGEFVALDPLPLHEAYSVPPGITMSASLRFAEDRAAVEDARLLFLVEFLRRDDGGYVAHVPSLPVASTQGSSLEEAVRMVRENLQGIIEEEKAWGSLVAREPEYLSGMGDTIGTVEVPLNEPS
jgi:predicted RNase H-like HicB family nuclease